MRQLASVCIVAASVMFTSLASANHQTPIRILAAFSNPSLTQGPHGTFLSLDYAISAGADTLYWDNNLGLSGTATQPSGPFQLWKSNSGTNGDGTSDPNHQVCINPVSTGSLYTTSHQEKMIRIDVTYEQQNFRSEYWHMGTNSTGTKADGASFGTQATFSAPCAYYSTGSLASSGPHIHQFWSGPHNYDTSAIWGEWTPLDPFLDP